MATRFELTINSEYVKNWTIEDAIRELYQNAFDNEIVSPEKKAKIEYDKEKEQLLIISPDTILKRDTLLLGVTSKSDNDNTVGCYGEGYKLAMLVFARNNIKAVIKNNKANEEWTPKIIKSRRFNSDVLVIDTRVCNKNECKSDDLVFIINGISETTYKNTQERILDLDCVDKISTTYGDIILSEDHAGEIYSNKLFVCKNYDFKYGYNIKPKYIPIDRDRKNLNYYSFKDIIKKSWLEICKDCEQNFDRFYELISKHNTELSSDYIIVSDQSIRLGILESFFYENRRNAIPVYTQKDINYIKQFYKKMNPVSVTYAVYQFIIDFFSEYYSKIPTKEERKKDTQLEDKRLTPMQVLIELKSKLSLSTQEDSFFQAVIEESEDWIIALETPILFNKQDDSKLLKLVKTGIV